PIGTRTRGRRSSTRRADRARREGQQLGVVGALSRGSLIMAATERALPEERLRHGRVDRHAELAVVVEGVDEHGPRPLVIAGIGPVEEHLSVPVLNLRTL